MSRVARRRCLPFWNLRWPETNNKKSDATSARH